MKKLYISNIVNNDNIISFIEKYIDEDLDLVKETKRDGFIFDTSLSMKDNFKDLVFNDVEIYIDNEFIGYGNLIEDAEDIML